MLSLLALLVQKSANTDAAGRCSKLVTSAQTLQEWQLQEDVRNTHERQLKELRVQERAREAHTHAHLRSCVIRAVYALSAALYSLLAMLLCYIC